jgi:hypothetical protein
MTFPAHIAPVLDFVASAEEFTPAELPGTSITVAEWCLWLGWSKRDSFS